MIKGDKDMTDDNGKITLPKELKKQMMEFFMKTSIPRIKQEQMKKEQELREQTAKEKSPNS